MAREKPTLLLEHYLKQLKLPTILHEHKSMAVICAKEGKNHTEFLLRLCERELLDREQRAAQRRIKAARFPILKTLDTFDFKAQPGINKPLILELMRGDYLDKHENTLLLGNPGTGKTHIATALAHAACMQGKRVRFFTVTALVTLLLEAREERQLQRFLQRLEKQHLLVLDEFGYVPFSKQGAQLLFQVLAERHERKPVIITTNKGFGDWTQIFGDPSLTAALLDRVTHRAHVIDCSWDSYRLFETLKNRRNK